MEAESSVARAIRIAAEKVGSKAALGRAVGVPGDSQRAVVWAWIDRGRVPPEYCPAIKRIGGDAIGLWDLCPDDWHRIWPELIGTEGAPPAPEPPAVTDAAAARAIEGA